MTMTEIKGRLRKEIADKDLANAVLSQLAYRSPKHVHVEGYVTSFGECEIDNIECPNCGHEFDDIDEITSYCPDCGQELYVEGIE